MAYVAVNEHGKVKSKRSKKRGRKSGRRTLGTVYLMKVEIEGVIVYKIGLSARKLINRMVEQTIALHGVIGYLPRVEVIAEIKTKYYYEVERYMLDRFKESRCKFNYTFNGSTEYVDADEDELLKVYKEVKGNVLGYIVPDVVLEESKAEDIKPSVEEEWSDMDDDMPYID